MALGSFAHDALADLSPEDLTRMLELDETLFVEHKTGVGDNTAHGLMKAVGSFANTLGGWVLLGIKDSKPLEEVPDWAKSEAPPLVDFVRDRLRHEIDPLPAFEAKAMTLPAGPRIGVIRVYESTDTPHISIRSGAVYVREVAGDKDTAAIGKAGSGRHSERAYQAVQIRSRAQLLELAQRGKEAAQRVDVLLDPLRPLPLVASHLPLHLEAIPKGGLQPAFDTKPAIVVRLAPLTLSSRFQSWATTADCSSALLAGAEALSGRSGLNAEWVEPDPSGAAVTVPVNDRGVHADGAGLALSASANLLLDGAGVAGAAFSLSPPDDERRKSWLRLEELADLIEPPIAAAANLLYAGEFLGRARCQIDLVQIPRVFSLDQAGEKGRSWVPTSSDLPLPAEPAQIRAIAKRAANALWRSAGVGAWDAPG
jgi:hypothetical protein